MNRCFDIAISLAALPVAASLLIPLSLTSLISSGFPVFFSQARVGLHGQSINITKLRTMRVAPPNTPNTPKRAYLERERITPFGHFLRSSHLDELPQIWLVLRGDLSWVGPRPLLSEHLALCSQIEKRQSVRPGLMGLAQLTLYQHRFLAVNDGFALDLEYIDRASLRLDLHIIWHTIGAHMRRLLEVVSPKLKKFLDFGRSVV